MADAGSDAQTCIGNGAASSSLDDHIQVGEDETEDLRWGWGSFRPKCLQFFNSSIGILVILSSCTVAYGMSVNGFNYAAIVSLEKRFHFNSKQTGLITSITHASSMIVTLFVSFFGSFGNKPRWMGICTALAGVGLFLFAVPHFMVGRYNPPEVRHSSQFCNVSSTEDLCEGESTSFAWSHFFVFLLSQMITGAGGAAFFSLGIAYLDENVNPKNSSVFIGIFYALSFVGPSCGFIIGGQLLSTYVDIEQPEGLNITPRDPRWIGNWWIGSLVAGVVVFMLVPFMLGSPKQLPNSKIFRQEAMKNNQIQESDAMITGNVKDIIPATKKLLVNPVYMFQTLGVWTQIIVGTGVGPFLFKMIRFHYGATPAMTGIGIGMIGTISSVVGTFIGSLFGRTPGLKQSCQIAAKYCFLFQIGSMWMCFMFLLPGCEDINVPAPINSSYTRCNCDAVKYMPVCVGNETYYSPCHAGCPQQNMTAKYYSNCSAVHNSETPRMGVCDQGCKNVYHFLGGFAVLLVLTYFNDIPGKIVTIRSVAENQRAYALGLQLVIWRALGAIPAPVLFGSFFDKHCKLWRSSCGSKGDCLAYDSDGVIRTLLIASIICQIFAVIFFYLSWHFSCKSSFLQMEESNHSKSKNKRPSDSAANNGSYVVENGTIAGTMSSDIASEVDETKF